jgi:G3E family GTPase
VIPDRIPLSIGTGFLGSGKTTLIAALLKQPDVDKVAVIVNEFGAVGVDDAIFAQAINPDDVLLLANGCLCCSAGSDLCATVWALTRRAIPPRRIIIETSGLADPAPTLRQLIGDLRLRGVLRFDGLVATIDGINGARNLAELPIVARQCAVADRRIITKLDLATPAQITKLVELLSGLNPLAPVEFVANGAIAATKLFDASLYVAGNGAADPNRWLNAAASHARPARNRAFFADFDAHGPSPLGTWVLEEIRPINWAELSQRLSVVVGQHGDKLLRMKGLIYCVEENRPLAIHGVQRVFIPRSGLSAGSAPQRRPLSSSAMSALVRQLNASLRPFAVQSWKTAPQRSTRWRNPPSAIKRKKDDETRLDRYRSYGRSDGGPPDTSRLPRHNLEPYPGQGRDRGTERREDCRHAIRAGGRRCSLHDAVDWSGRH